MRELRTRLTRFRGCFIGPFTARESLTNNGGLAIFLKTGWLPPEHIRGAQGSLIHASALNAAWPHPIERNRSRHESEGCGDGR